MPKAVNVVVKQSQENRAYNFPLAGCQAADLSGFKGIQPDGRRGVWAIIIALQAAARDSNRLDLGLILRIIISSLFPLTVGVNIMILAS